jgi:hypothetical protein
VLEPIFEADLPSEQHAYRPGKSALGVTALPQRGLEGWENWAKQKTASKTC